jgi:hypothetical protein
VLSVSDFESFHLSVAEGAASRAVPVVLPWQGADSIYPAEWISRSPSAAVDRINQLTQSRSWRETGVACREVAVRRFGIERVLDELVEVVTGVEMTDFPTEERV